MWWPGLRHSHKVLPRRVAYEERAVLLSEVRDQLKPTLYDEQNGWWVDYVRLRFAAVLR